MFTTMLDVEENWLECFGKFSTKTLESTLASRNYNFISIALEFHDNRI